MQTYAPASFGLVMPGEAMWIPFQAGFAVELGLRLQKHGYGEQPFDVAVGSSSGSLVAALAAAGSFDHERTQEILFGFAEKTRLRFERGRPINPYPDALKTVLDWLDKTGASTSRTHLIVTASHYESSALRETASAGASALISGFKRFFKTKHNGPCDLLQGVENLVESGAKLVIPHYFSNKFLPRPNCRMAATPADLRLGLEASTGIPWLYRSPTKDGSGFIFDGAFASNAPLRLALDLGPKTIPKIIYTVTSSRSGQVYDRPFQNIARRGARAALENSSKALGRRFPVLKQMKERIPAPESVDLKKLQKEYPDQRVVVIHPPRPIRVNRFFETNPTVLRELYEMGRDAAQSALLPIARDVWASDTAAE